MEDLFQKLNEKFFLIQKIKNAKFTLTGKKEMTLFDTLKARSITDLHLQLNLLEKQIAEKREKGEYLYSL